jgi:hypothetical protein
MKAESNSTLRLPKMSDIEAAGKLMRMPGMVEAEATMPNKSSGVPKLVAKGLSTGFFDILELRMAKNPSAHSIIKKAFCVLAELIIRLNLNAVLLLGIFFVCYTKPKNVVY